MYGNWLLRDPGLSFDLPEREGWQRSWTSKWPTGSSAISHDGAAGGEESRDRGCLGDVTDIPGFLLSVRPETGKVQWKWNTAPNKGEPGSETWPAEGDAISHGGGMTWMTGHL